MKNRVLADRDVKTFTNMIAPHVIRLADELMHRPAEALTRCREYFALRLIPAAARRWRRKPFLSGPDACNP